MKSRFSIRLQGVIRENSINFVIWQMLNKIVELQFNRSGCLYFSLSSLEFTEVHKLVVNIVPTPQRKK